MKTMPCKRSAVTLLELLVSIAIIAVVLLLAMAGMQKVHSAARKMETDNNLRQIILATHQLSDESGNKVSGLSRRFMNRKIVYKEKSIFNLLDPILYGIVVLPQNPTDAQISTYYHPPVKCFLDASDLSLDKHPDNPSRISYVCNMLGFDGFVAFTYAVSDGNSNTIAFTTHFYRTGLDQNDLSRSIIFARTRESRTSNSRRATFADAGWDDILPVTNPTTRTTVSSVPGLTFQLRPSYEAADSRLPQAFHSAGLSVAMFDGSVRTLSPRISESTFWSLVTPNGGEVLLDP